MRKLDPRVLVSLVLLCAGCDDLLGNEHAPKKRPPAAAEEAKLDVGGPVALPPAPLERAEHKLRFGAKGAERMGFALPKLSRLYALAGAVEIPEWAEPGDGAPRSTRDDDMRTAWSCTPGPDRTCAIGIHFPQSAEVEVVRLYVADPGGKKPSTRPSKVRVHTTEGRADARFSDDDRHWHVVLGEPVATRNLTLEILETHDDGPVHLAELEVYGRTGAERPPLELDLARRVITFERGPWKSKSRVHNAQPAFVEQLEVDGRLRRVLRGTAVVAQQGDRMILLEHADWTNCSDQQGTYDLVDLKTRVVVPVGDLGGYGARMFRHAKGLGWAMGTLGVDDGSVQAAVLDGEDFEHRRSNRLDRESPTELLKSWQIDPTPVSRSDTRTFDEPPAGCSPARLEDLEQLQPHLPKRTKIVADQWYECSLGDGVLALMTTGGDCGRAWHVGVLDSDGELLGVRSGKEANTHARLRRIDGETLLLELWGSKDDPMVLRLDVDGATEVSGASALTLRPPAACRKPCSASFDDLFDAAR